MDPKCKYDLPVRGAVTPVARGWFIIFTVHVCGMYSCTALKRLCGSSIKAEWELQNACAMISKMVNHELYEKCIKHTYNSMLSTLVRRQFWRFSNNFQSFQTLPWLATKISQKCCLLWSKENYYSELWTVCLPLHALF